MVALTEWQAHVYRTDGEDEVYVGFFLDQKDAEGWIKKQDEGVYEVRAQPPPRRKR